MNEEQMKYVANLISQDLEKDKEIERLNNIIKADEKNYSNLVKEWKKQNNIIDELEKWLKDVDVFQMNFIENKEHITPYKATLDKLKALKEGKE